MREILFRGKSTLSGNWVYGYLIKGQDYHTQRTTYAIVLPSSTLYPINEIVPYVEVIPETVGQWTGLTDCHGVKIFEGDIHGIPGWVVTYCADTHEGLGMNAGWYVQRDNFESWMELENHEEHNIIGNVYDNPELMKSRTKQLI
jgi:uncharacterized phage protein (TIGR01671 family)